jgi:hypothetical protein
MLNISLASSMEQMDRSVEQLGIFGVQERSLIEQIA